MNNDYEISRLVRICRALVIKYGLDGRVTLSKFDLIKDGKLLIRTEADARNGSEDTLLKVETIDV